MNATNSETIGRKFLTTRLLCARYNISDKTVDRWLENPALGFPKPMVINGRRLWDENSLTNWERQRASRT